MKDEKVRSRRTGARMFGASGDRLSQRKLSLVLLAPDSSFIPPCGNAKGVHPSSFILPSSLPAPAPN